MFKMMSKIDEIIFDKFSHISLFFARLLVAYGFLDPALNKWNNIEGVASWFASMGIPAPLLNTYMTASIEMLGVVLLSFGLFTRYISFSLIIVMLVAIFTVHFPNGFAAGDNGYEIPLYYIAFLLVFLGNGAGKLSIDNFIFKKA